MASKNSGLFGSVIHLLVFATTFFPVQLQQDSSTIEPAMYAAPIGPEMRPISNTTITTVFSAPLAFSPLPVFSAPPAPVLADFAPVDWLFLAIFGLSLPWTAFLCARDAVSALSSLPAVLKKPARSTITTAVIELVEMWAKRFFPQHDAVLSVVFGFLRLLLFLVPALPSPSATAPVSAVAAPSAPSPLAASCRDAGVQTAAATAPPPPHLSTAVMEIASFPPADPASSYLDAEAQTLPPAAAPPLFLTPVVVVSSVAPSSPPSHPLRSYRDAEVQAPPSSGHGEGLSKSKMKTLDQAARDERFAREKPQEILAQSFEGKTAERKARLAKQKAIALEVLKERGEA